MYILWVRMNIDFQNEIRNVTFETGINRLMIDITMQLKRNLVNYGVVISLFCMAIVMVCVWIVLENITFSLHRFIYWRSITTTFSDYISVHRHYVESNPRSVSTGEVIKRRSSTSDQWNKSFASIDWKLCWLPGHSSNTTERELWQLQPLLWRRPVLRCIQWSRMRIMSIRILWRRAKLCIIKPVQ